MPEEYREKVIIREETGVKRFMSRAVFYLVDIIELLLATRFILRALSADPQIGFVDFVYRLSAPLVTPFQGIFPPANVGGIVLEWSTLLAMLVYVLLGMLIVRLFQTLTPT